MEISIFCLHYCSLSRRFKSFGPLCKLVFEQLKLKAVTGKIWFICSSFFLFTILQGSQRVSCSTAYNCRAPSLMACYILPRVMEISRGRDRAHCCSKGCNQCTWWKAGVGTQCALLCQTATQEKRRGALKEDRGSFFHFLVWRCPVKNICFLTSPPSVLTFMCTSCVCRE